MSYGQITEMQRRFKEEVKFFLDQHLEDDVEAEASQDDFQWDLLPSDDGTASASWEWLGESISCEK